ncbi:MAG: helix-turn-helix transcriptional regulator [Pirellulaceae bacterium]|nr:helix-turn-helix transcriptional regulator [Pirellulaceae bacterium]
MKSEKHKRSPCPVACVLDILGDKWTLLIVRDMLFGRTYFNEFCRSPEGIATNILADRLEKLVHQKLVEKYTTTEIAGRDAYRLTSKGKSLKPVLDAVAKWGLANIEGTEAKLKSTGSP